jgi:hypothetical protein
LDDQTAWNRLSWEHNEGCLWIDTKAYQICPFCDQLWLECKANEFITGRDGKQYPACKRARYAGKSCANHDDEQQEEEDPDKVFEGIEVPEVHS